MSNKIRAALDGNEAAASVAYRTNEVCAIYPITPSSAMGEFADVWATKKRPNIWGLIPDVVEMQSEGGAIGAVHGALQAGTLCATFTASQGLLLKIPTMYKIAGELNPLVIHVAARSLATHALSIFGDHSDVMACRQCGFAMLSSNSVQEAHDLACIAQASTLRSRIPFLHFFDGFRTSHEVGRIEMLSDEDLAALIPEDAIAAHRKRALSPDHPTIRGTAQNPDTFFQAREACNPFYLACPEIVVEEMERFAARTGRRYQLFDYVGHPEAERVVVLMGSGAETAGETVERLADRGEKVGAVKVRLYRPFSLEHFVSALPATVRGIAVLDRTKEPGSLGEPLYQDVVTAISEAGAAGKLPMSVPPRVLGGRYGLSSKEFTPAMVKAVLDHLDADHGHNHFTVGINDDVTHLSLPVDTEFRLEQPGEVRALFYGLGADGTVGANKNSIKIIADGTELHAQGYFVYDSKKSGAMTVSHLRFGPRPIRAPYLVEKAGFVGVHQFNFLERMEILHCAEPEAVFLLNAPFGPDEVWDHLPREVQEEIIAKKLRFYVIDAPEVAQAAGLGRRINTVMQVCFFAISGVLPRDEAIERIKGTIQKTYGKKGPEVVKRNFAAVDAALSHLHQVKVPDTVTATQTRTAMISEQAPEFVQRVIGTMMAGKGDLLPVSAFTPDGTWPTATTRWEKRNIAAAIPVWDPKVCIQCNKCAFICPHAAIRAKVYDAKDLNGHPESFQSVPYKGNEFEGKLFTIQVAPEDCTGCTVCVEICPAKDKTNPRNKAINMEPQLPIRERERANYACFLDLPEVDRSTVKADVKGTQFLQPLFEYSGACAGCGETAYVKLLSQLFGDRLLIANATGCSSIYGGNLPTTPYTVNSDGRGPAWSNSLFENNAEFGFGMRLAVDELNRWSRQLTEGLGSRVGDELTRAILGADQHDEAGLAAQRIRVEALRKVLAGIDDPEARRLEHIADYLVKKSVWMLGGDGWAYDIGFGGLDHVISMDRDVNILVVDTEVYSNTGGQKSKATPLGAAAKFAEAGKEQPKKDLGLMAMTYGSVYVAQVASGAKDQHTVKAFLEAESYDGPSLIIANSPCIAHGYDLARGPDQQKSAVRAGVCPLYRFDPRRIAEGLPPLQLDSGIPRQSPTKYMELEARFRMPEKIDPERFQGLMQRARTSAAQRYDVYRQLAGLTIGGGGPDADAGDGR